MLFLQRSFLTPFLSVHIYAQNMVEDKEKNNEHEMR